MLASTDHNLQLFHDQEPVHTHQKCSRCYKIQRGHAFKLSLCNGCQIDMYCSKECQVADWPNHKTACKQYKKERIQLAEMTGIASAAPDIYAWMKYYDTPLKNCAVAALNPRVEPHSERTDCLYLQIRHTGDTTVPISQRFIVESVGRESVSKFQRTSMAAPAGYYDQACNMGRIEMGSDFYGVARYALTVVFGPENAPNGAKHMWKHFSINKSTARAARTRLDW
ncbi:hypothetical protein FB45DRAFT_999614 [Roridomyces roridus]|uniref:MYND-type domain-containing protein n=1 Tax=Roridomyces roridus TaxID=1738132 RepID=A0AAD7CC48_9AGAR|nr:hypothetical protein FB45DRAFT_999614 [Roridomyces roridus]